MKVTKKTISDYKLNLRNPNRGTERGVYMVEQSFQQLGAGRSIVTDGKGGVIAGNHSMQAAESVGIRDVIEIETDGNQLVVVKRTDLDLDDPNDDTARRLAIADNRASEVGLSWDADVLWSYLEQGTDLSDMWHDDELAEMFGESPAEEAEKYTRTQYEPSDEKPAATALYDETKTQALLRDIEAADLPDDVRHFLTLAAYRHTVINYAKVADFYAHSEAPIQRLMEASALIILDIEDAVDQGVAISSRYVK